MSAVRNVANAPRDAAELVQLGRFNLREIAKGTPIWQSEAERASFMGMDNGQMAETLSKVLQEMDGVQSAASPKPAAAASPARTPVVQGKTGTSPARQPVVAGATSKPVSEGGAAVLQKLSKIHEELHLNTEQLATLANGVTSFSESMATIKDLMVMSISLNLKLAEQVLQASSKDVIEACSEDMEETKDILRSVLFQEEEGGEPEGEE